MSVQSTRCLKYSPVAAEGVLVAPNRLELVAAGELNKLPVVPEPKPGGGLLPLAPENWKEVPEFAGSAGLVPEPKAKFNGFVCPGLLPNPDNEKPEK